MEKSPLAIELLEYLSKHFPSTKQYSITDFLRKRQESKEEIIMIIKGLAANSFIHSLDNLETSLSELENTEIKTNITYEGERYINSFFERKSNKSNIKYNRLMDIIAKMLAFVSIGFAVYSWSIKEVKDKQIETRNDTINTQRRTIDSMTVIVEILQKKCDQTL